MGFTEEERKIFPYKRAGVDMKGDPMALLRRFTRFLGGDARMAEVMDAAYKGDPEPACAALIELQKATCGAFDLGQPWDAISGHGVQEEEWFPLYCEFFRWLKKNAMVQEATPTCSPCSPASDSPDLSPTTTTAA